MLRKKGKCYYNITIAWFFILKLSTFLYILIMKLLHFLFFLLFRFFSFLFVFIRYLWITIFFSEKIVIVRKRSFSIGLFVACFCCILPAVLPHFIRSRWFLRLIRKYNTARIFVILWRTICALIFRSAFRFVRKLHLQLARVV